MQPKSILIVRILTIVLLSMAAAMTLLGAVGTTCVAFNAENYGPRMAPLIPVKPVFQVLVFVSLAAGLFGAFSIVRLARGRQNAYQHTLVFLAVGLAASGIQFYYSLTLRGSTAPNNVRLYLTGLALLALLLLRLPGIWNRTGFSRSTPGGVHPGAAGGLALLLCGLLTVTAPVWATPTHLLEGSNMTNVLLWPLLGGGGFMILLSGLTQVRRLSGSRRTNLAAQPQHS